MYIYIHLIYIYIICILYDYIMGKVYDVIYAYDGGQTSVIKRGSEIRDTWSLFF